MDKEPRICPECGAEIENLDTGKCPECEAILPIVSDELEDEVGEEEGSMEDLSAEKGEDDEDGYEDLATSYEEDEEE